MFQRENSDYLRKEVLSKNFYLQVKSSLEELKKKQNFRIPLRDRIRIRAEELWQEDINKERNDLDNWLLAEKEVIYDFINKTMEIRTEQNEINRCLMKIYGFRC